MTVGKCFCLPYLLECGHRSPCWMGGWLRQQRLWSQVWRKDLYFCWLPHMHWCESSKYPWCGNMTSHYRQRGEMKSLSYVGRSKWRIVCKGKNDSLVAVGKVKQVLHCHKGVAESFSGGNPLFCINQQHLLQQAHKLPTVCLLREQVTTFQIHHQVHLEYILLLKPNISKEKSKVKGEMLH